MYFTNDEINRFLRYLTKVGIELELDGQQAEDQAQEALMRAWKYLEQRNMTMADISSPFGWLSVILRRRVIDFKRKEYRLRKKEPGPMVEFDSASIEGLARLCNASYDRAAWHECLSLLKERAGQEIVEVARLIGELDYTIKEAADRLGLEVHALRKRLESAVTVLDL